MNITLNINGVQKNLIAAPQIRSCMYSGGKDILEQSLVDAATGSAAHALFCSMAAR